MRVKKDLKALYLSINSPPPRHPQKFEAPLMVVLVHPPMIKNCQRVYCSFPYYSLILVLPFSTLTIVLHLKDRRQSNEQTNNTRNSYGSKQS